MKKCSCGRSVSGKCGCDVRPSAWVNIARTYALLAEHSQRKSGFIAWPITLADGTRIAGLYRGFGATVAVTREPKGEKGFRALGPIFGDSFGNIRIQD
jgi:hypothetical protein